MVSVAEIVILSFVASGVIVTLDPATRVKVSVALSAETVVEPTVTLLNAFWLTYELWVWLPAAAVVEVVPIVKLLVPLLSNAFSNLPIAALSVSVVLIALVDEGLL